VPTTMTKLQPMVNSKYIEMRTFNSTVIFNMDSCNPLCVIQTVYNSYDNNTNFPMKCNSYGE
jgi:hypothetical protein